MPATSVSGRRLKSHMRSAAATAGVGSTAGKQKRISKQHELNQLARSDNLSGCRCAPDVAQKAGEHTAGRQQIGAAHDIGDRFGKQGMHSPQSCQRPGQPDLAEDSNT